MKFSTALFAILALASDSVASTQHRSPSTSTKDSDYRRDGKATFLVKFKNEVEFNRMSSMAKRDIKKISTVQSTEEKQLATKVKTLFKKTTRIISFQNLTEDEIEYFENSDAYTITREHVYRLDPQEKEGGFGKRRLQYDDAEVPYGIDMVQALDVPDNFIEGSNVTVCIVDTGIDIGHPDLQVFNVTGKSFIDDEAWNVDTFGHGTHVAGTIAALKNDVGVLGVVNNGAMKLLIAKVCALDGWCYNVDDAVQWCADEGADVINLSLGCSFCGNEEESDIYQSIYDDGVLVVAAAGNGGPGDIGYPASYDSVMSVAAVDLNEEIADFSSGNEYVEIAAPGVDIKSTVPGNDYAYYSGTSMASPHIAGVAALIWSHFPGTQNTDIRKTLVDSAKDLGDVGRDQAYGHGLVRAKIAYDILETGTFPPTVAPTSFVCNDDKAILTVSLVTDAYPSETSWDLKDKNGTVVLSGNSYSQAYYEYTASVCIDPCPEVYTFTMYDSWGDGSGPYTVVVDGDLKLEGNGDFSYSADPAEIDACALPTTSPSVSLTPTSAPTECDKSKLVVRITPDIFGFETTWSVTDIYGAEILSGGPYSGSYYDVTYEACVDTCGVYTFAIGDYYGDGIYTDESFEVKIDDEVVVVDDGTFTNLYRKVFSGCGTPLHLMSYQGADGYTTDMCLSSRNSSRNLKIAECDAADDNQIWFVDRSGYVRNLGKGQELCLLQGQHGILKMKTCMEGLFQNKQRYAFNSIDGTMIAMGRSGFPAITISEPVNYDIAESFFGKDFDVKKTSVQMNGTEPDEIIIYLKDYMSEQRRDVNNEWKNLLAVEF